MIDPDVLAELPRVARVRRVRATPEPESIGVELTSGVPLDEFLEACLPKQSAQRKETREEWRRQRGIGIEPKVHYYFGGVLTPCGRRVAVLKTRITSVTTEVTCEVCRASELFCTAHACAVLRGD